MAGPRRPESVLVVVYTDDGDVLLLRRVSPFDFWQSVTGSLDPGETHAETARRELSEETGLTDEGSLIDAGTRRTFTIDPRWRHKYAPGVTENVEHEWLYRLPGRVDIASDPEEHSESVWVPLDKAIEIVWSWTNRAALERLREDFSRGRRGAF
jgi:dATP pyrophosphohydrolase